MGKTLNHGHSVLANVPNMFLATVVQFAVKKVEEGEGKEAFK